MIHREKKHAIALAGFALSYILIIAIFIILMKAGKIGLPFHGIRSPVDAWFSCLKLLPILGISLSLMLWLIYAGLPVIEPFFWKRFSSVFFIGLAVSIFYAVNTS